MKIDIFKIFKDHFYEEIQKTDHRNMTTCCDNEKCKIYKSEVAGINESFIEFFIVRVDKGFFIKKVINMKGSASFVLNKQNLDKILKKERRSYPLKQEAYKIFIPDKGIPTITSGGKRAYLSPNQMYAWTNNNISLDIIRKITQYSCPHQQWWVDTFENNRVIGFLDGAMDYLLPLDIVRKSSNMQSYLNKINYLDHPVSASWFKDRNIINVTHYIIVANKLNNPIFFLQNVDKIEISHQLSIEFYDTLKMANEIGEKFSFYTDLKSLTKQHDKILEIFLEKAEPQPINMSEEFVEFSREFPNYKLINDGNKLSIEGKRMKHCVASRSDYIRTGSAGIYHVDYGTERGYTFQLNKIKQEYEEGKFSTHFKLKKSKDLLIL